MSVSCEYIPAFQRWAGWHFPFSVSPWTLGCTTCRQFCAPSTYPNTIIPREAFGFHWLDTGAVADGPTAQTVAALHFVSYHLHLEEKERGNKMCCSSQM